MGLIKKGMQWENGIQEWRNFGKSVRAVVERSLRNLTLGERCAREAIGTVHPPVGGILCSASGFVRNFIRFLDITLL